MFTFGPVPAYQGKDEFELGISDDKRAFTLDFSDFQASVDAGNKKAPIVARHFSLIVPLVGDGKRVEIEFGVSGAILVVGHATATAVFSVNGQTVFSDRVVEADGEDFVLPLKFVEKAPTECRLCVFLLVGRDSAAEEGAAFVNVKAIDAEILPRTK